MSEWLRSWSRKPMGSARAGSNPVAVEIFVLFLPVVCYQLPNLHSVVKAAWPSGLRRQLQALVRKGVGSNPTAVIYFCHIPC